MENRGTHSAMITALAAAALVLGLGCSKDEPIEPPSADGAENGHWMTDFEAAKQAAQAGNKDLLINVSGSDWCYWCKRLDKEVFSKPAFVEEAKENFVFVLLDFPRDKPQRPEIKQQNRRLADTFGIQGYPTVLLADEQGDPYARTGYVEGGAQNYLEHLRDLRTQKTAP